MTESLAEWMDHNPKGVAAMGVPLLLFLFHTFLENDLARVICGIVAACTMMAVMTARWTDLMWPCIGFIAWSAMAAVSRLVDKG